MTTFLHYVKEISGTIISFIYHNQTGILLIIIIMYRFLTLSAALILYTFVTRGFLKDSIAAAAAATVTDDDDDEDDDNDNKDYIHCIAT